MRGNFHGPGGKFEFLVFDFLTILAAMNKKRNEVKRTKRKEV